MGKKNHIKSSDYDIKFSAITLENFQNVKFGAIDFPLLEKGAPSNFLAIYGANGTSKTTVVKALSTFSDLLTRTPIGLNCINCDEVKSKISIDFLASPQTENLDFIHFYYEVEFSEKGLERECLSFFQSKNAVTKGETKYPILEVKQQNEKWKLFYGENVIFSTDSFAESLIKRNFSEGLTAIFDEGLLSAVEDHKIFENLDKATTIFNDSVKKIFIGNEQGSFLAIFPHLFFHESANNEELERLKAEISLMNTVLPAIFPDIVKLDLDIKDNINEKGEVRYKITILVEHQNLKNNIPLDYESLGTKKIINVLFALLNGYINSDVVLVIDEFDSSIFEFLLGQLVEILGESAGQIIITSHNLRILEKISYRNVYFSTLNENNRYVPAYAVKKTNNLRDMYIRSTYLGEKVNEEIIYQAKTPLIREAFDALKYGRKT